VIKAQVLAGGRGKGKFDNGFQGGVHTIDKYVTIYIEMSLLIWSKAHSKHGNMLAR
jgi:succinyl-CoA synthetase beta subunit